MNSSFERRIRQARQFARRYPALDSVATKAGSRLWQFQLSRRSRHATDWFEYGQVIEVDPRRINLALWRLELLDDLGLTQRDLIGQSIGGDWDKTFPLSDLGIFEALRQRFEGGLAWQDIDYFEQLKASVEAGQPQFKYRSLDDFGPQFERIDELWQSLQEKGYRTQSDLDTDRPWDEVVVGFDRRGRTVFVDGRHRLALARVMGLTSIPALVAIRHKEWVHRVGEFTTHLGDHSGISYQPVPHPDLADLPSKKGHERPDMILEALPVRSGRLLDIGSNKGYLCHRFEDAGFDCIAAERSERELYFLNMFRDAAQRRFTVWGGDVLTQELGGRFDVVLALNIFHHFLKDEEAFEALTAFLTRLSTRYMAFEPHLADDRQMTGAFKNFSPEDFVEFVKRTAGLPHSRLLGDADDGRPLYLLSRTPLPPL